MDYHAILPEPLVAMPVPAELNRFRIPFLEPTFLENTACRILRQTWADPETNFYIQFTYFNILSACSIAASPNRGHLAATLIYIQEGNLAVREKESEASLPRMEGDFYLRKVEMRNSSFILDFDQPGSYQIVYIAISEKKLAYLQESESIFQDRNLLRAREIRKAGAQIKSLILEMQQGKEPISDKEAFGRYLIRRTQKLLESFIYMYDSHNIYWHELLPEDRMEHLKRYIQNNLGGNLTLPALSGFLHIDKDVLRKMFLQITKMPISKYIQKERIKKACTIMDKTPERTMEKIAEDVGYYSRTAFYKAFKEVTGRLPHQYRKNHGH